MPPRVTGPDHAIGIYFFTPIMSLIVISILGVFPPISYLKNFGESEDIISRFIGMFLGVGIIEETCKAVAVFYVISKARKMIGKDVYLGVDGGVDGGNAALIKKAGADVLVSGSYIFKSRSYKKAIESLRKA